MTKLSFFVTLIVIFSILLTGMAFGLIGFKKIDKLLHTNLGDYLNMFPVEIIQVEAPFRYTTEESARDYLIDSGIQKVSFFNINMNKIIKSLEQNPWIKNIQISRIWPNKIKVKYLENEPLAYLNKDSMVTKGDCSVVKLTSKLQDAVNNLNSKNKNQQISLPFLVGDKKNTKKLCDTLANLEIYVKPINKRIKKLVLSKRDSVYLELDDGLTLLLGKNNILERASRFASFISSKGYESLKIGKDAKVNHTYIDMRYHNGLAIGSNKGMYLTELMETA